MKHHYRDITDQLGTPGWWDENGVPRYCDFSPEEGANIYAQEICLLEIHCQACARPFQVAMSSREPRALEEAVRAGTLHYGDPPCLPCCPAGPTMNSVPVRVIEFWERGRNPGRRSDLEIGIESNW